MHLVGLFAVLIQEQTAIAPGTVVVDDGRIWLWIAMVVGVLALVAAGLLARAVIASDTGTPEMQAISNAIREGAEAFLRRQYKTIGIIAVGAGGGGVCRVPAVAANGAVCAEDGDQLPGGRGLLRAGGLYGDVLLDPGEYPHGLGGA